MNMNFFARGKREDTKAWVEGYLIEQNSPEYHAYIIQSFKAEIDDRHIDILECDIYEVIPETVGWCTGLRDKNDNRIFEGDIVKGIVLSSEFIGDIVWIEEIASFGIGHRGKREPTAWENSSLFKRLRLGYKDQFAAEIIGNIHDNPELLSYADVPVSSDISQPVLQPATPENFELRGC